MRLPRSEERSYRYYVFGPKDASCPFAPRPACPSIATIKPKDLGVVVSTAVTTTSASTTRRRAGRNTAGFWPSGLHAGHSDTSSGADPTGRLGLTVNELILAYARFADGYYVKEGRPTVEPTNIRLVLRLVRNLYGTTPINAFGPLALKAVRDEMISAGNCRSEINRRVGRIVRMFKWGVTEELIPPRLRGPPYRSGLRKGRSAVERSRRSSLSRKRCRRRSSCSSADRSGP